METGVPVWALDAAAARATCGCARGEASRRAREVRARRAARGGRRRGPVAVLFGRSRPARGRPSHPEIVLFSVAAPGVPPIHVEEALWTVWDTVAGD